MALIFKSKKKNKGFTSKEITANDFLNVKDIKGNILYSKDNLIFAYIKLSPINIDLLSEQEKIKLNRLLAAELSNERKPFKLFIISRPVDISRLVYELSDAYSVSTDPVQKDLLKNAIITMNNFAMDGEVSERLFYIIIWEKFIDGSERELLKRAAEFAGKFENAGIRTEIADQGMIIKLCNLFANPAYAHLEDSSSYASIPILNGAR